MKTSKSAMLKKFIREQFAKQIRKGFVFEKVYKYYTATGTVWCRRVRLKNSRTGAKIIRPVRYVDGQFQLGEPRAPEKGKPLYGLSELLLSNELILIVEGEPCVDALTSLGLVATTSGSATSASAADWSPLQGRECLLWPDKDSAGLRYMDDVAAKLREQGCTLRIINVDKLNLLDNSDCVDWIAANPEATAKDILALPVARDAKRNLPKCVEEALGRYATDPGAIFQPDVVSEIARLQRDDAPNFARARKVAKTAGVPMMEFDQMAKVAVTSKSKVTVAAMFPDVEPWPETVSGESLANEMCETIKRYVVASDDTVRAAVLWTIHTWCLDVLQVSPIANITAPDKRCGKSVLLTMMAKLCSRPLQISNITAASVFRAIEAWSPTLLIDEVDSFLVENGEIRGILNSGITRDGAFVIRCDGEDHAPKSFSTWAAKALCGIGKIADTLRDRSIPLRLSRKRDGEHVEKLRHAPAELWKSLQSRIHRWVDDNRASLFAGRIPSIESLNDRANDCWEPLLVIADRVGGHWPNYARNAAIALQCVEQDAPSNGAKLLADIQSVFVNHNTNKIFTSELLIALAAIDDAPWATWDRGRCMSAYQLSELLAPYGVSPKQIRINAFSKKGYQQECFEDAFARYVTSGDLVEAETTKQDGQPPKKKRIKKARKLGKNIPSSAKWSEFRM